MKLGIFGFGYVAQYFVQHQQHPFDSIVATSRQSSIRLSWHETNQTLLDFNWETVTQIFQTCDVVLSCIPPNEAGRDPVLDCLDHGALKLIQSQLTWLGYLSSTSVYGDHFGDWVTETSSVSPCSNVGQKRLDAESQWMQLYKDYQMPVHIFRLAGIYGPKRNAIEKIRVGKPSIYKENHFFSRIHVADICRFLNASMNHPSPGECFNVSDDFPAPSHLVDAFAASLINAPMPKCIPFEQAHLSPMGRQFYLSNKRVCNEKIKKAFNMTLRFPTFREGLTHASSLNMGF